MPLNDDTIKSAVQRYKREYDCYEKLCKFVAAKCEREIIRANTLRAAVTARAKAPGKLGDKLHKKYKEEAALNTVDDALGRLTDLAGVRISTYLEVDRDKVVEEIKRLFDGPDGGPVEVVKKDKNEGFYRATHCQVTLKADDLVEPFDNLESLTCEIQVCSLLAHVWNELEHDLVYKPTTGVLSNSEKDSLDILGNLTLSGDVVIKQLFEANAARVKQAQDDATPFQDVYDFVARIRDKFPDQTYFGRYADQLCDDLIALGFDTPAKVQEQFLSDGYAALAADLIEQLQQYLQQHHDDAVQVEPDSSDRLLVLVLATHADQVLAQHPMGRGRGRPPRIASFAHRFKQMKQDQAAAQGIQPPPNAANDQDANDQAAE